MSFEIRRSLHDSIRKAESILILSSEEHQPVVLHSALALAKVLRAMNKQVAMYYAPTHDTGFLTEDEIHLVTSSMKCMTDTQVVIALKDRNVQELKYEQNQDHLHIILNSDTEPIQSDDIRVVPAKAAYDLVITLDVSQLADIGPFYNQNQAFFQEVPCVALSSTMIIPPAYAQIAWVHKESSCVAEMLYLMFKESYQPNVTNSVKQSLLTGISQETQALRSPEVTPRTLVVAAELMEQGAILPSFESPRHIHTDSSIPLPLTKLVGRVLAHLEYDLEHQNIAFSKLYAHDFEKTGTIKEDLYTIFPLLSNMCGDRNIVHIMIEGKSVKEGIIYDRRQTTYQNYQRHLDGELYRNAFRYSYPSPLNVHHACQEVNTVIGQIISGK